MKIIDHGSYFPKLSNTILSLVLLIIMSLSTMTASVQAQESNLAELFASAEAARAPESLYFVTRSRFVTVDVGLLSVNTEIVLNLFPDVSFIGVVGNVEQNGQNSTSWIGHLKDVELSNFVLVEADHIFTATISSPEGVYQVKQAEASIYEIQQIDPSKLPGNHIVRSPEPMEEKLSVPEVASGNWPAVENGSQIDIMVLYTPAAKSYQGSTAAMNSFIDTAISQVNTSYANSGVTPRLRLVYRAEIPYTEDTSNLNSDIERLQAKSDGFMDEIHTLRDTYNADLVSLFTGPTAPYCNATYNMDYVSHSFESLAFSTVNVTCATSNYSFAIALGASQGAQTNEDPDILPYLYAHDYIDVLHDFRTIMANDSASCPGGSCTHLLYWSNPNLTWNGYPMGVPENQPNPAENWKVLNNTAWTVANFRSTDSYEPDDICSQAKVIGLGSQQTHSVSPIGDADWAKFTLTQISNITISTSGFAGDTELWLYSSNCTTLLGYNDDNGVDLFSTVNKASLGIGTYYVLVKDYGNNSSIETYDLRVSLTNNAEPTLTLGNPAAPSGSIRLWEDSNFNGLYKSYAFVDNSYCYDLAQTSFDNVTSSLQFIGGYIGQFDLILYSDNSCGTYIARYGSDATSLGLLDNETSSIRIEHHGGALSDLTVTQGDVVTIQWVDTDPDTNAILSLARDTDNNPQNNSGHTLIVSGLKEDPDTPEISILNGKVNWQVSRDSADQYIYRNIPEFSGPVKLTVNGQVNSAENNCIVKAGIGSALNTGPAVEFGYFGGGCPVNDYLITASIPLNLSTHTCDPGSAPDWLWINPNIFYDGILRTGNTVLLEVPGIGSVSGPAYSSSHNRLYVGLTGDGDWPSCSGSIERITVEPLNNQAASFTEEFNSANNFTSVADQYSWNTANVQPGTYYIWGAIDDGVNPKVYSLAPGKVIIQPPPGDPTAQVVINEVAWAGTQASDSDEWVELYNPGTSAVALTGWKLKNSSSTIPLSGVISAGGYFLLERQEQAISNLTANQISSSLSLANGNQPLQLLNNADTVIDTANANGGDWPGGIPNISSSFAYSTMERIDSLMPDSDWNWATNDAKHHNGVDASSQPLNGTPGQTNSISYDETDDSCNTVPSISLDQDHYDILRERSDIDVYQFKVTDPYTTIIAVLSPPAVGDFALALFKGCDGPIDQVWDIGRRATHIGGDEDNKIYVRYNAGNELGVGTYYLTVRTKENGVYSPSPYLLNVKLIPPNFSQVDTLILYNPTRFKAIYGQDNASLVMDKLTVLANRPDVNGLIIHLDQFQEVTEAYENWDAATVVNGNQQSYTTNVNYANLVADTIRDAMRKHMEQSGNYITSSGYVVIVGDDHQIPFRRLDIRPPITGDPNWKSETEYYQGLGDIPDAPIDAAMLTDRTLSDNFYGDYQDPGVPIPSLAVGRLLDTPARILNIINSFIDHSGVVDLTSPTGKVAVAGYTFLADSAQSVCSSLANNGLVTDCALINPPNATFSGNQLFQTFILGAPNLVAHYGHANHSQMLAPMSPPLTAQQISNANFSPTTSLWWMVGCQSGLVLPNRLSLAQALGDHGVTYLGNTGWAWGSDGPRTYTEFLYQIVVDKLRLNQSSVAIGEALRSAKYDYFKKAINNPYGEAQYYTISYYDRKVLAEATLYGLPMLKFNLPGHASGASIAPSNTTVIESRITGQALPSSFIPLQIGPENLNSADFHSQPYNGNTYYTYKGDYAVSANGPVLPQSEELNFGTTLGQANGVIWKGGNFIIVPNNNPLVLIPTQLNGTLGAEPTFSGTYPLLPVALLRLKELDGTFTNHLTFQTGQYLGNEFNGTLRLFTNMEFTVGLWKGNSTDNTQPVLGSLTTSLANNTLHIELPITDASGVYKAFVTYTELADQATTGLWQSKELTAGVSECTPGEHSFSLNLPLSKKIAYFIQVMDCAGNVSVKFDNNKYYQASTDLPFVSSVVRTDATPSNASSVNFLVNFSEPVTGVDKSDFALTTTVIGANVTNVAGLGSSYTVTVNTGSGNGTLSLNLVDDDSIKDQSNNPLGGTGAGNGNYASGEIYMIIKSSSFSDTPTYHWAWNFIERLYAAGITGGCGVNPPRYCPEDTVTRAQMAVFLLRGVHTAAYSPPAIGAGSGFGDVPLTYWAAAWIKQLAAEGITTGCGGGYYCPENPVTRAQMAVFLLRSKHGGSYVPPGVGAGTGFGDVPANYWSAAWIKQLVTEGITSGCGGGNYCPEAPVTRAQMAVFLVRTFGLP